MSFPFCAPKEDNEVEENDENFFFGKYGESFCKWSRRGEVVSVGEKKEEGHFCLNQQFCFVF